MAKYSNQLKQTVCEAICDHNKSTIYTAEHYNIPLKTVEKWVTAYHKDPQYFKSKQDFIPAIPLRFSTKSRREEKALKKYGDMSNEELRMELLARDVELARLKKGYVVRKSGGRLEYGTFSN